MFLSTLFDTATAESFVAEWPAEPALHQLPADSKLPLVISAETLNDYLATGCIPAAEVNIVRNASPCHPTAFTTADGYLDPAQVRAWRASGFTVQLRHLERWHPATRWLLAQMRRETGCGGYVSAFITPPGEQGLLHHWDQALGIIVQLAGTKTWEVWRPVVELPARDYRTSIEPWDPEWLPGWKTRGPDLTVDLVPGQVLVLPRGWVHNPHSSTSTTPSVHLTFVLEDRLRMDLAEQMVAEAINAPAFRASLASREILDERALTEAVDSTRALLVSHLAALDPAVIARALQK